MRHRVDTRKLGRTSSHRVAMYRNMVTSLLDHGRVETTHAKARELRRVADRMITLAKRGDLHARRQAASFVRDRAVTAKLFGELAERFEGRPGGYTRVLRTRRRVGDAAEMSIVELVEPLAEPEPVRKAATTKKAATKKTTATMKATAKKATTKKTAAKTAKKATRRKKTSAKEE